MCLKAQQEASRRQAIWEREDDYAACLQNRDIAKNNMSGESFDIITLHYHTSPGGQRLKDEVNPQQSPQTANVSPSTLSVSPCTTIPLSLSPSLYVVSFSLSIPSGCQQQSSDWLEGDAYSLGKALADKV
jgi:hypothetical protein